MTLTTDEAAQQVGVKPSTIRRWVMLGELTPIRLSANGNNANPMRFREEDVTGVAYSKANHKRHARMVQKWQDACSSLRDM